MLMAVAKQLQTIGIKLAPNVAVVYKIHIANSNVGPKQVLLIS
jgi:hypothetical protein